MTEPTPGAAAAKRPSIVQAALPIVFLVALLGLNVFFFGDSATSGPNQIALLLAATAAGLVSLRLGIGWQQMKTGMVKGITSAMPAIIILLLIGALAGTWLLSGVVPAMIYYGLKILHPSIFLFASCVVCALVSLATGSSWSTVATVGIALLAIGTVMGFHEGLVAGAIISGAYFGDKMSPLSDTTNLAPAMAGTDLFTHIRYMAQTTVPSISIALVIFLIIGFTSSPEGSLDDLTVVLTAIDGAFNINLWLFIVPAAVIVLIVRKVPAIPALFAGVLLGAVFAIVFQPAAIQDVASSQPANAGYARLAYAAVVQAMATDTAVPTGNALVDDLLSAGGMEGILPTVWLILCAMIFGGVMESSGLLRRLTDVIISKAKSTAALVGSTIGTCIFFNLTASDQYLAIVVPGRMFADTYRERGLKPEVLSRSLEDSGTVTSALVPWNTCGAYHSGVLGVATLSYVPFAFFNLLSPLMSFAFALFNIRIRRYSEEEMLAIKAEMAEAQRLAEEA